MLNEDTRIIVETSVGQSGSRVIKNSIGQGTGGAALVVCKATLDKSVLIISSNLTLMNLMFRQQTLDS